MPTPKWRESPAAKVLVDEMLSIIFSGRHIRSVCLRPRHSLQTSWWRAVMFASYPSRCVSAKEAACWI